MAKTQRGGVGGSQDLTGSPVRHVTRASARNSPVDGTNVASRNPSPMWKTAKKMTKRKGTRVSPLLRQIRSITSEWEKGGNIHAPTKSTTSSVRQAVLQDSQGPAEVTHFPWSRFSLHPLQSQTHPLFCRQLLGRLPFARWSIKILLSGTIRISCATPEAYRPVPLCFASVCIINCMSWICLDGWIFEMLVFGGT
ncbi:uncharacterized protein LOC127257892 [Andrographis paniculata]|uniref:uncharacterized protein LOC127257892 n=1 Tax=Andrographis paniculata TaxID=175694 RepID=UPI0021E9716B|nr:uncharacterized protein LOC127257892 [Andrographis paniculata]